MIIGKRLRELRETFAAKPSSPLCAPTSRVIAST
jgi:hypothetical protein